MAISLYDASIPTYLRMLKNLEGFLDKGEAYAQEKGVDFASVLDARLAPDMANLTKQIQFVSDGAKNGAARLAGQTPPAFPDTETTLPELRERIAKTAAFVKSVPREAIDGQEERAIELKFPSGSMHFTGQSFLLGFSLPNFLFHCTTAYAILRAQGVPLGKMDYLAA